MLVGLLMMKPRWRSSPSGRATITVAPYSRSRRFRFATNSTVSVASLAKASGAARKAASATSAIRIFMAPSPSWRGHHEGGRFSARGALVVRSASGRTPLQAREVGVAVRRRIVALRSPDGFGQALDRLVDRPVALAGAAHELGKARGDARRLVDRKLFLQGHVEAHVQERIALVDIVALAMALGIIEDSVVLRVRQDHAHRHRLDADQRLAGPVFAPGAEERLAYLLARGIEHVRPWSSAGTRTGRGSGTRDTPACARYTRSARAGSANDARSSGTRAA